MTRKVIICFSKDKQDKLVFILIALLYNKAMIQNTDYYFTKSVKYKGKKIIKLW